MQKAFLTATITIFLLVNLFLNTQVKLVEAYPLDITVISDKEIYNVGETVQISGNLTFESQPLSQALVALQINDRAVPYTFRTLYTGEAPPSGPWYVEITNVYLGDSYGNPITSIKKGDIAYIYIYYQNTYSRDLNVTIAFTIYDVNNVPLFAHAPVSQSLPPGTGYYTVYTLAIPENAEEGTATIYASAFTALPENEGTPYSPEKSNTFNIMSTQTSTSEGSYSHSFQIAKKGTRLGNYTVFVASFYQGYKATKTTSYQVILLGDINNDLYVNVKDAVLLGVAFGSEPGDLNWDARADLNKDGYINIKDAVILGTNFGNSAI